MPKGKKDHSELLMSWLGKRKVKELECKLKHFWDLNILLMLNFIRFIKFSPYKIPANLWRVPENDTEKEPAVDSNWKYRPSGSYTRGSVRGSVVCWLSYHLCGEFRSCFSPDLWPPLPPASGQVGPPLRAEVWLIRGFQAFVYPSVCTFIDFWLIV